MGFLDRAKSSFTDRFGDEVVRRGTFGARESEAEEFEEQEPEPQPRQKRQPRQKLPREKKPRRPEPEDEPEEFQDDAFEFQEPVYEQQDSYEFPEEEEPQVINQKELAKLSKDQGQSVEEILRSMKIAETFTIDEGILFLDAELANQEFATQAPYGYDMGEVDFFLTKTQRSVAEYVKLLRIRNDDVVKLAGRISDMMVELNNMRFNSEVANGINIMASGGDDDALAVELQEARARAQRLQEELDGIYASGTVGGIDDQNEIESLRNELAAEHIARERFEQEAQDLRAHMVLLEEEYDIQVFSERGEIQTPSSSGYESYAEQRGGQFQQVDGFDTRPQDELYAEESSYQQVGRDHWLPGQDDEALPVYSDEEEGLPDGSFEFEEESLEELPIGSFEGSEGTFSQADSTFQDSGFTADPYQSLDEFIEDNIDGFPEDNKSSAAALDAEDDDPDEDGFQYSFERQI